MVVFIYIVEIEHIVAISCTREWNAYTNLAKSRINLSTGMIGIDMRFMYNVILYEIMMLTFLNYAISTMMHMVIACVCFPHTQKPIYERRQHGFGMYRKNIKLIAL